MKCILVMLVILLLFALSKWAIYRLSVLGILLYYAERGIALPDTETIQKYMMKVTMKSFHIKED